MEIKNRLFPYPVLCADTDDYTSGSFSVDTEIVSQDMHSLILKFHMKLDNPGLKTQISQGRAEYIIHMECTNTAWYGIEEKMMGQDVGFRLFLAGRHYSVVEFGRDDERKDTRAEFKSRED